MPRLLLVDGHSNLYRAFYAIRAGLASPDGTPTNAAYGFLRMQHKLLRDLAPTHVAVAFDVGKETFRTRLSQDYKAQRPPMPQELQAQVPITQEALRLLGLAVIAEPDVEADDVIGTLATRAAAEGFEVVIASTDKDLMQLVCNSSIRMWHTRLERMLDEAGVQEVFGVPPAQVGEVLAIMGDSSDNIPGCPGIGEKGARELIARWGTVANVYANLESVTPPRAQRALTNHRSLVELSHLLVQIRTDVPVDVEPAQLARGAPDSPGLADFYGRFGFVSLLAEMGPPAVALHTGATSARRVTQAEAAQLLADGDAAIALHGAVLGIAAGSEVVEVEAGPSELGTLLAGRLHRLWCHDAKQLLHAIPGDAATPPRDAMLAGYLLAPGDSPDLPALCRRFGQPAPAQDAAGEARAVATLVPQLVGGLEREGLDRLFTDIELPLVPVLVAMERRGILLDVPALADLGRRLTASLAELERDIHAEAGGAFNINSPQQLADVLFARRGLPVVRRTSKTRAPSTDADVLAELAARGHVLPALILEFREQAKLKSTYVDALPRQVAADGRVHTRFNQAVAATGRLSSSDPNLQNIPVRSELGRAVRSAFIAAPASTLVVADYSQIELRVLAHMADEPALERAFAAGEDIHRATAALVFGLSPELVGPDQRRAAKTINFGLIYGMSAFALARELGVSNAEAQRFIDAYFARLPRVREFLEGIKSQARVSGKVSTMFGRVRWIRGLDAASQQVRGNAERQAINAPVQGTAADLIKVAMIKLHNEMRSNQIPGNLLLQVHDELVIEVEERAAAATAELARRVMEGAASLRVPLRVDVGINRSWADAKG